MSSTMLILFKGMFTYLLFVQIVLQLDAYFALRIRQDKNEDISDAYLEILGLKVEKAILSLIIAIVTAFGSRFVFSTANANETDVVEVKKTNAPAKKSVDELKNHDIGNFTKRKLDVVVVGCGLPKKGMGWFHLNQLLEMPNANVTAIVEPFFLNQKLCSNPPESFKALVKDLEKLGITCTDSVTKLPSMAKNTMCLIAGRTNDNPALFKACIDKGAKTIYLEKPGAPSVSELQDMSDLAKLKGVKVYLGYNKNVTPYVEKALKLADSKKKGSVTFCHNNSYKMNELNECFSRNSEGMLKNMAIHELALLVSYFGVNMDTIAEFKVNSDKHFTELLTVWVPGTTVPNEKYISDFSRISFTVKTKNGKSVTIMANRTGGNVSYSQVLDEEGVEIEKFEFPDREIQEMVKKQCELDPEMMPYFFIQSKDYFTLKDRVINSALNKCVAEGIATIDIGIEALKLAEYFTIETTKALRG